MRTKATVAIRVRPAIESKAKAEEIVAEEEDTTPVPSIAEEEEGEEDLDETERALMAQLNALKGGGVGRGRVKGTEPGSGLPPTPPKKTKSIFPPKEKPIRHNDNVDGERPWIKEVSDIFHKKGYMVDELHIDFRLDISSLDSDWRISIIELLGDKFTMAAYFDFTVGYATRKVASLEYIVGQDKVAGIEWLIESMKKFTHRDRLGRVVGINKAPQYIEEEIAEEE